MNISQIENNIKELIKEFGRTNPTLPLKEAGNIVQGNACRLDWEEVCPKNKNDEERLEYLFKLYEKMIAEEKTKGGK